MVIDNVKTGQYLAQFHQSMNPAVVAACVVLLVCSVCIHCTGFTSLCSPNYSVTEAAARYTAFVGLPRY